MIRLSKALNQAGDTIVEVMVATTILALVLGVAFTSANRSLNVGTDAANRKQALQYAESQVDLLRVLVNNGTLKTGTGSNIPTGEFCVGVDTQTGSYDVRPAGTCDQGAFHVGIRYQYDYATGNGSTNNQTFSILCQWQSSSSQNQDQVILYYQDPEQ